MKRKSRKTRKAKGFSLNTVSVVILIVLMIVIGFFLRDRKILFSSEAGMSMKSLEGGLYVGTMITPIPEAGDRETLYSAPDSQPRCGTGYFSTYYCNPDGTDVDNSNTNPRVWTIVPFTDSRIENGVLTLITKYYRSRNAPTPVTEVISQEDFNKMQTDMTCKVYCGIPASNSPGTATGTNGGSTSGGQSGNYDEPPTLNRCPPLDYDSNGQRGYRGSDGRHYDPNTGDEITNWNGNTAGRSYDINSGNQPPQDTSSGGSQGGSTGGSSGGAGNSGGGQNSNSF